MNTQLLRRLARTTVLVGAIALLTGCLRFDVAHLSSDRFDGRDNNTPGGVAARDYLIDTLAQYAPGAMAAQTGDAAYTQTFPDGVNVLGRVTGTTRPDEHVIIGGHYDHHSYCGSSDGDIICNGATDNATGAAMVLEAARRFAADPPDRTVVFALWDAEEDGLLGSKHYVEHPVLPLAQTVAYLNMDIMGADLLPTLRSNTFAIGAETGGATLQDAVGTAYDESTLDGVQLSALFGQYRSDYASFVGKQVPTVFFTDSTGPCYHTVDDELEIVDFPKLEQQTDVLYRTAATLAYDDPADPGTFVTPTWESRPAVTHDDAAGLLGVMERSMPDWGRFPQALRDQAGGHRNTLAAIVAGGPENFDDADVGPVLNAAVFAVSMLTYGECDGFLE